MTYFYYSENGRVKMTSEEPLTSSLQVLDYTPNSAELIKVNGKHLMFVESGQLTFYENPNDKVKDKEALKLELKQKAETSTLTLTDITVFIKNFL